MYYILSFSPRDFLPLKLLAIPRNKNEIAECMKVFGTILLLSFALYVSCHMCNDCNYFVKILYRIKKLCHRVKL